MDTKETDRKKIGDLFDQINQFMISHNDKEWAQFFEDQKKRLVVNDPCAFVEVLSTLKTIWGGMGSFNDLNISSHSGHKFDDRKKANAELKDLQSQLYKLAQELSKKYLV